MSSSAPAQKAWTDAYLDEMRAVGDPPADEAVAALWSGGKIQAVNEMMAALVDNDDIPAASMPSPVQEYLQHSGTLPAWADPVRIQRSEQLFWRHGPVIITNLFCYGLPFCYAAQKGVQVLALTSRLYSNPTRRIIETAQMVVDVMRPGGLGSTGAGVRSAQKVRLMHAGVRHQIKAHPELWKPEWDTPINQEDMAGTLMAFSWVCLDGLTKLGYTPSEQETEDYLHCWKVVGHVLGIRDELLPADMTAAHDLSRSIQRRQYAACEEGRYMTDALVKMMQYHIPGNLLDGVPAALTRYLLGDSHSDLLGVQRDDLARVMFLPLRLMGLQQQKVLNASPELRRVCEFFSRKLIEGVLLVGRGGNRVTFHIPTELRQTWGINWVG